MNKKVLGLALLTVSMFGLNGFAKDCNPGRPDPFEGIQLTEQQRASVKQLRERTRKERMEARESARADKKEMKESFRMKDSVMRIERRNSNREYLKELKSIIGEDNYVVFLENSYVNSPHKGHKAFNKNKCGDKKKCGDRNKADRKRGDHRRSNSPVSGNGAACKGVAGK